MPDLPSPVEWLHELLAHCVAEGASDLHLAANHSPHLRLEGQVHALEGQPVVHPDQMRTLAEWLTREVDASELDSNRKGAVDGALNAAGGSRFRYNVFRQGGSFSIALRRLEDRIRSLGELGLPDSLYDLAELKDGLVLLAGPTGCGKSTTLATLIDRINRSRPCHIVTIEDPIEYVHPSRTALVNQRQVGTDTSSFNDALVASLRQDPDVILVGEIRDLDTIRTAVTAAETGHLVFSTVHAGDCVGAIDRLVSVFPADEQPGVRRQLSMTLRGIIAQHLVVADGSRNNVDKTRRQLVLASEVLMVNSAVANLITAGKSNQIYSMMETGKSEGMYTVEESLGRLWMSGEISERTAMALARNPQVLASRARRGFTSGASIVRTGGMP